METKVEQNNDFIDYDLSTQFTIMKALSGCYVETSSYVYNTI